MVKARPRDKDAREKYSKCKAIVTRLRFERAIAVDDGPKTTVADSINIEDMSESDQPAVRDGGGGELDSPLEGGSWLF